MKKQKSKKVSDAIAKAVEAFDAEEGVETASEEAVEETVEMSLDTLDFDPEEADEAVEGEEELLADNLDQEESVEEADAGVELQGTELENFEAADIGDVEVLTSEQIFSIVEAVLFSTDRPVSIATIKTAFKGTQVRAKEIREALAELAKDYLNSNRGFTLEEVASGFHLRTKQENMKYLRQGVKARPFKLSGPALEVLSIVAYKQPTTKAQIDEIRGVESGHLLRALMEKSLLTFGERSDLPGKPMFYETTRKFLEIFSLRNLQELPSLNEIDQLIPEGIGEVEDKETLSDLTEKLSQTVGSTYSEGEDELMKISGELDQITTSSEFFEQEKRRQREKRDSDRAQDIREALLVGEAVDDKDKRWLERYETGLMQQAQSDSEVDFVTEGIVADAAPTEAVEPEPAVEAAGDVEPLDELLAEEEPPRDAEM